MAATVRPYMIYGGGFMKIKQSLVNAAIAAVIGLGVSDMAAAEDPAPKMEKCYGIAKAGKNDCGTVGGNACAAQSRMNNDPKTWIFVPKGTCEKITGGNLTPPAGEEKAK